jgi:AraC-like DNA-binding protein
LILRQGLCNAFGGGITQVIFGERGNTFEFHMIVAALAAALATDHKGQLFMGLEVIPTMLYSLPNLKRILCDKRSAILHKTLTEDLTGKEKFVATSLIVYIDKGQQIIRDHDNRELVIKAQQLIFLPKDVYVVSDFVIGDSVFEAYLFFIDDQIIDKYLASTPQLRTLRDYDEDIERVGKTHTLQANDQISAYIHSLTQVYADGESTAAILELKLLELLHLIAIQDRSLKFVKVLSSPQKTSIRPRCITEFMAKHYSRDLKVEDYALLTGRSVSTFIRDFKKAYGMTPSQWLIEKKVSIAHRMLVEHNCSVTTAALEAGYENVSHFIKAYKRRFGVTPKKAKLFSASASA